MHSTGWGRAVGSVLAFNSPCCPGACVATAGAPAAARDAAPSTSDSSTGSADSSRSSMDDEEAERIQAAVEVVAEMQLTAEQLKVGGMAVGFDSIAAPHPQAAASLAVGDARRGWWW